MKPPQAVVLAILLLLPWLPRPSAAQEVDALPARVPGIPEPPAEAIVAEVPFEPGPVFRIFVDLAREGTQPFVMMLDTGAAESVLTPGMARELGVSVRRTKSTPYRRATRLGRDLQFWIDTATSDTGSKTGFEYGLLGGEFLDDYVLELDYPRRRVRFLDPKRYEVPEETAAADERVLPFRRSGTRILTDVAVDGRETRVILDTGAPDTLILSGKVARKLGIEVDTLAEYGEVGTVMGPMTVRYKEAQRGTWGGFAYEEGPILVSPRGWSNMGPNDSVIGYDLLRQFTIRIDYKRKRLWLRRDGDTRMTFQGADYRVSRRVGALVFEVEPGTYQVYKVEPGGAAAEIGLRNGDIIVWAGGDEARRVEEIADRVIAGEELTVARRIDDGWVELILPKPQSYEADGDGTATVTP